VSLLLAIALPASVATAAILNPQAMLAALKLNTAALGAPAAAATLAQEFKRDIATEIIRDAPEELLMAAGRFLPGAIAGKPALAIAAFAAVLAYPNPPVSLLLMASKMSNFR